MAINISSPNPIRFSDIAYEFGTPPGTNLGAYRVSENIGSLSNLPLDDGIPRSGAISFSNFYGKRLNIVVDLHSIPQDSTRRNARDRYNEPGNNGVRVIGGFKTKPSSSTGTKVYVNVNKRIGSEKGNRNNVALRTGLWDADTELITIIGSSGGLYGAGGNGGAGGGTSYTQSSASQGGQGSSAFGVDYSSRLINQGTIFGGRGGGGGGSGAWGWNYSDTQDGCEGRRNETRRIGGAGGAGGRGLPPGDGGTANTQFGNPKTTPSFASNGTSGSIDSNGSGGAKGFITGCGGGKGSCDRRPHSGVGGEVESTGGRGQAIRTRNNDCEVLEINNNNDYNNQGSGGQRGYSIIIGPGVSLDRVPGHNEPSGDIISDATVL